MVTSSAAAGLVVCTLSLARMISLGPPSATEIVFAAVFGALMAASWVWPITLYIDGQSDGVVLDEGFFVLLVLLVPSVMTVLVFAVVAVCAQAVKRRPFVKSVSNVGQVVTSVGVGALAFVLLGSAHAPVGYANVGATLVGAVCYLVVNTCAMVTIMSTFGTPWRRTVFGGIKDGLPVTVGGVAIAVPVALLLADQPRYLPVAVLPLPVLRYLGTGHFYARHDRSRLRGLFDATLDVNRSMGTEETKAAVLAASGLVARVPNATLTPERPAVDGLAAPMTLADRTLWLGVSGRSRTEPFDDADQSLLEALAYRGRHRPGQCRSLWRGAAAKGKLSVITSSLGEGVCAISETGDITFMNPAGASMLGWYALPAAAGHGPVIPDAEAPGFLLEPAMRAMALRRNVAGYDTRFDRFDGSRFPMTMTASPVVGPSSPSGAVIVFRDTSERKAFEEQLARHALPGHADGPGQPPAAARPSRPRTLAVRAHRQPGRGPFLRHRPFQGGQRQPRPPGRRRAAAGHRRPSPPCRPPRRHALTLRR